jgi:peroxiredoxin
MLRLFVTCCIALIFNTFFSKNALAAPTEAGFVFFEKKEKTPYDVAPDSCRIEVFATGMPAGKVRLIGTYADQSFVIDSSVIDAEGHFLIRREQPLPAGYYYFLAPNGKNFAIMLDRDEQFVTLRTNMADVPGTLQVTGSRTTELFYASLRFQSTQDPELTRLAGIIQTSREGTTEYREARTRQDQLVAERKAFHADIYARHPDNLFSKFKQAGQNPDFIEFRKPNGSIDTIRQVVSYRSRFWDNVDFTDERLLRTPVVMNKLKRYIKELTPQNPDSLIKVADQLIRRVEPHKPYFKFFSNWIALQYENTKTTVMDGEAVYVHIVRNFFTPEKAFWDTPENIAGLQKHVGEMEASLLGRKGPDVRAKDPDGVERGIYEKTAPIIVVFMFSPDCEHCQKEAPEIQRLYEAWKSRGVDFYGIAVNTTDAEWRAFLKEQKFTFTNVFDPTNRAIYGKYFVDITPELYVLNRDRTIVAKNLHPNQLEEVFQREMKKMK